MKIAGMILGLVGGLFGIFGGVCTGAVVGVGDNKTGNQMMGVAIGAAITGIIVSIVIGVVKNKKIGLISGGILLCSSVAAFIAANFFSAPLMALGSILGIIGVVQGSK